jgi:serine/threonine-protein kinase
MELLQGATVETVVKLDGPQPSGRVLKVLSEVSGALQEAHAINLIHRDIKPANIILCDQGGKPDVTKLLDFGLVKKTAQSDDETQLTHEGSITGTPAYMAPENLTNPDQIDVRSDLYALGAVGYFMLTGSHVFSGNTVVEVCSHHLHTPPEPPSKRLGSAVDEDLEELLLDCLEKDPDRRPQSAEELEAKLIACRAYGSWTTADARRWWKEHKKLTRTGQKTAPVDGTNTIAVDLRRGRTE